MEKIVWVVDDDRSIRWVLEKALARENVAYRSFTSADEVLEALQKNERPDVVLSDVRMPGTSGLSLLAQFKEKLPAVPVIIMTAHSDLDSAVLAFQGGAFEYLPKPFDVDQMIRLLQRALQQSGGVPTQDNSEAIAPEILGRAPAMQEVFRVIGRLSQSSATVLITGESGTGKELVARALHRHSMNRQGPFVAINTAAIPRELLESELFGHERGSFTGAIGQRTGRFEQAEGGTLFLDEIGDMPADLQTRLLRVLSDGQYYRVGGQQSVRTNVRIIAATHQNLEKRVEQGLFREDLFHRLNVIRIRLPALRERRDDLPLLIEHFLKKSAHDLRVERKSLSAEALEYLIQEDFSGNVRQLENLCHWITVMAPGNVVERQDLPAKFSQQAASSNINSSWESGLIKEIDRLLASQHGKVYSQIVDRIEALLIERALFSCHDKRVEAAAALGVGRNTITRKINELGLDKKE